MTNKPYHMTLEADGILYCSGQVSLSEGGIQPQTAEILDGIFNLLADHGYSKENIMRMDIFLQDMEKEFAPMDEIYRAKMGNCKPTRITVGAQLFREDVRIEVGFVAHKTLDNRDQ